MKVKVQECIAIKLVCQFLVVPKQKLFLNGHAHLALDLLFNLQDGVFILGSADQTPWYLFHSTSRSFQAAQPSGRPYQRIPGLQSCSQQYPQAYGLPYNAHPRRPVPALPKSNKYLVAGICYRLTVRSLSVPIGHAKRQALTRGVLVWRA